MSANSAAFERASHLAARLLDNVETVVHVMLAALIAGSAAAIAASASAWTGGVHAPRSLETVAKPAMQVILRSKLDYPTGLAVDPRDSSVETVVPPSAGLQAPSGLVLHAGSLWVGDYATGRLHVFGLDGSRVRVIDTKLGRTA